MVERVKRCALVCVPVIKKGLAIVLKILQLCGLRKLYGVVWEIGAWEQRWVRNSAGYLCFVVRREPCAAVGAR